MLSNINEKRKKKEKKEKVCVHKQIYFRSFKTYSIDEYEKVLCQHPNYEKYSNVKKVYNNFFQKLIELVNETTLLNTVKIKIKLQVENE